MAISTGVLLLISVAAQALSYGIGRARSNRQNRKRLRDERRKSRPEKIVASSGEGGSIPWVQGANIRVDGHLLQWTEIQSEMHVNEAGGVQHIWYTHTSHCAYGLCRSQISKIKKIYMDNRVVYSEGGASLVASLAGGSATTRWGRQPCFNPAGFIDMESLLIISLSTEEGSESDVNLQKFEKRTVTISGASIGINGTYALRSRSRSSSATPGFIDYVLTFVVCFKEPDTEAIDPVTGEPLDCVPGKPNGCVLLPSGSLSGDTITLSQTTVGTQTSIYFKDFTLYPGSDTQNPDPLIEDNTSKEPMAYRGTAYIVFEDLRLDRFGNQFPSVEVVLEEDDSRTLQSCIEEVFDRAELPSVPRLDFSSGVQAITDVSGVFHPGDASLVESLETLLELHDVRVQDTFEYSAGSEVPTPVLRFFLPDEEAAITVAEEETTAHDFGETADPRPRFDRIVSTVAFDSLSLSFFREESAFREGVVMAYDQVGVRKNTVNVGLFVSLSTKEARKLARRLLDAQKARASGLRFSLPPSYHGVRPSDRLRVTLSSGVDFDVLLTRVEVSTSGRIECEGTADPLEPYEQFDSTVFPPWDVPTTGALRVRDLPPLSKAQATTYGLTFWWEGETAGEFPGVDIYYSFDGTTWRLLEGPLEGSAIWGESTTVLGAQASQVWDDASTVSIELGAGSLSDATHEEVAGGRNWALLGGEIIGFRTATNTSGKIWQLSGLLRGRRNTEDAIPFHEVGESFVLLRTTLFKDVPQSLNNRSVIFRAMPAGQDVNTGNLGDDVRMIPQGRSTWPFQTHGVWSRAHPGDQDICVWMRPRYRCPQALFGKLSEDVESDCEYVADVYREDKTSPGDVVYVRRLTGCSGRTGEITFRYSAEEQRADFYNVAEVNDGSATHTFDDFFEFRFFRVSSGIRDGRIRIYCVNRATAALSYKSLCV